MKAIRITKETLITLTNLAVFAFCAAAFVQIFFFPEHFGDIIGRIWVGINHALKVPLK